MPRTKKYPDYTLEEALLIPRAIFELGGRNEVRRLTVFDQIKKAPESGPSRTLVATCNKYGLINGGAAAEHFSVTELGANCVDPDVSPGTRAQYLYKSGIEEIEIFRDIFQKFVGSKMPARTVLLDELKDKEVQDKDIEAVADRFIENCNFIGLVKVLSGAERLIPIEQVVEEKGGVSEKPKLMQEATSRLKPIEPGRAQPPTLDEKTDFSKVCFYITAIGDDGSEERRHSDLFLGSIVEPALEPLSLHVVRADRIAEPGMITSQVIEYIFKSALVVADLSFHNPNVFYELALRHISRKPTIQVARKGDRIPFDINQFRTIVIDTGSIYDLVPKLETYKADIRNHARSVLKDPSAVDNPVISRYPNIRVENA